MTGESWSVTVKINDRIALDVSQVCISRKLSDFPDNAIIKEAANNLLRFVGGNNDPV